MAPVTETRRTVTTRTTRSVEGANQLKANINNIATELARVRDQARQEVGALEKIRGMLDVGYLTNLLKSVEELEERIETLETETQRATGDAGRLQSELDQERSRLEKLWAAYKTQEDELERVRRDYPLLEEKLFERERAIESMRKEIARVEQLGKYKSQYEQAMEENRLLQKDINNMDSELKRALDALRSNESELQALREIAPERERALELEQLLEEERERLAKLYKVYEETEEDKKDLDRVIEEWNAWFRKYGAAMETVGQAAGDAPMRTKRGK